MIIRDSVQINRAPDKVWKFIENPELMKQWNPKVQWVTAGDQQRGQGFVYGITYVMSGKAQEFRGEYVAYDPPRSLVIRLTSTAMPQDSFVEERYTLTANGDSTLLEQRIEIRNSGINIFWRLLAAFIMRFGKPVGKRYLETLKELVEGEG
jgi:uncharacterized protein YndB with AHSA1/START domain